jgi:hypothetical protein
VCVFWGLEDLGSYMLMPTLMAVGNHSSTKASSWIDTCSSDGKEP